MSASQQLENVTFATIVSSHEFTRLTGVRETLDASMTRIRTEHLISGTAIDISPALHSEHVHEALANLRSGAGLTIGQVCSLWFETATRLEDERYYALLDAAQTREDITRVNRSHASRMSAIRRRSCIRIVKDDAA